MESVFILTYFVYSFNFFCSRNCSLPFFPLFLSLFSLLIIPFLPSPAQPLLSPQELGNTKAIVKEFGRKGGAGEKF